MANNREPVKHDESESDPSEEEGDEGSSDEVGSQEVDSDIEPTQVSKKAPSSTSQKKVQPHPAAKPLHLAAASSSESGSESEAESDGPNAPKSNIGAKKPVAKPSDPEPVTPAKSTVTKRPANDKAAEVKDAKKGKKKTEPETEVKPSDDSKKARFQRLWSEDDEIVILEGMIEYTNKKKSDPTTNLSAFHDFIKKNLHLDVSRAQLQDKIRKLKKKYENNKSKEKEGKDRVFSKPHEQKAYQLSKSIWGNDLGKGSGGEKGVGSPKANGSGVRKAPVKKAANAPESDEAKGSKSVTAVNEEWEKKSLGKRVSIEERIIASGEELFETGKGLEGERQWKKLKVEEVELHLKLLELRTAQAKLFLDALKSEEH